MNRLLDDALDAAVAPGYTSLGFTLRSRSWKAFPPGALSGRGLLVTGASSGIGAATVAAIVRLGGTAHMLVRDPDRGAGVRREIVRHLAGAAPSADLEARLCIWSCDVSDLADIARFADHFGEAVEELHGVVHNAGVLTRERERSAQGFELTFAVHALGPYLLTRRLGAQLHCGAPSSVVFVASGGMYTASLDPSDIALENREFDGPGFYAHAKRIQVALAAELGARHAGSGISYASMHPGWVDTPGLRRSLPRFRRLLSPLLRTPSQGADTIIWLLASGGAAARQGAFWHDRRPRPEHRLPGTRETAGDRRRLLDQLDRLTAPWCSPMTGPAEERKES